MSYLLFLVQTLRKKFGIMLQNLAFVLAFLLLEKLPHHHFLETFRMRHFKVFFQNERFTGLFRLGVIFELNGFFEFTKDLFRRHFSHDLNNRLFRNRFFQKRSFVKIKVFEIDIPPHGNFSLYD